MFRMLYHFWYKSQDLDVLKQDGLRKLCNVLCNKNIGQRYLIGSVIEKHFQNLD